VGYRHGTSGIEEPAGGRIYGDNRTRRRLAWVLDFDSFEIRIADVGGHVAVVLACHIWHRDLHWPEEPRPEDPPTRYTRDDGRHNHGDNDPDVLFHIWILFVLLTALLDLFSTS